MISRRMIAMAAVAALFSCLAVPGTALACDKQAQAAAPTAEAEGCAKKVEAKVAANGVAVEAGEKPCAKADGVAAEGSGCAKAKGAAAEGRGCCAKAKGTQIAKAEAEKPEAAAAKGGR